MTTLETITTKEMITTKEKGNQYKGSREWQGHFTCLLLFYLSPFIL